MDIAVLSDVHGNYTALQSCIDHALSRKIRSFLFLGDYVGEMAYPQRSLELLYRLKEQYACCFIKGNKEDYWLNYADQKEQGWYDNHSTTGSLLYTYRNLTPKDLLFFRELPFQKSIVTDSGLHIKLCHGNPEQVNGKLLPKDTQTLRIMESTAENLILCGHTHIQGKISHMGKTVLNPGSVGIPLGVAGKTQFMLLCKKEGTWTEEFISLDYDYEKTIADLYESALNVKAPFWCRVTENLLRNGDISHRTVLNKAMTLCRQEEGECRWPDIPEKYWEQAVKEMLGAKISPKQNRIPIGIVR